MGEHVQHSGDTTDDETFLALRRVIRLNIPPLAMLTALIIIIEGRPRKTV